MFLRKTCVLRALDIRERPKLIACEISSRGKDFSVRIGEDGEIGIMQNGKTVFKKTENRECRVSSDLSKPFCMVLFLGGKPKYSGGENFGKTEPESLIKEYENHSEPHAEEYDDFAIAENNYYVDSREIKGTYVEIEGEKLEREPTVFKENAGAGKAADGSQTPQGSAACAYENAGGERGEYAAAEQRSYYESIRGALESLFFRFPQEKNIEGAIPDSTFSKIVYSGEKYYVVGVVNVESRAKYVVFGVPKKENTAPKEFNGAAYFVPCDIPCGGYYLVYLDAESGEILPNSKGNFNATSP